MADGKRIRIFSTHYLSLGEFEDRPSTYDSLVRGLIERVGRANPAARFRSGKSPLVFSLEQGFLVAMLALLVFILALVGGVGLSDLVLIKLSIIACFIPLAMTYARKNWPTNFVAAAIPPRALPGG